MILLFSILANSRKFLLKPSLEREGRPSFQTLPAQNDDFAIYAREDIDTTITAQYQTSSPTTKRETEYYCCSITIASDVEISNNYAFGSGMAGGSGGALFVSYSVLMSEQASSGQTYTGPIFSTNSASVGGALCFTASKVYLNDPNFNSNIAFKYGGGVYFQGVFEKDLKYSTQHVYTQIKGTFSNNSAGEIGGGIAFSNAGECSYFDDTIFQHNQCTLNGGAVYSINAPLQFYSCVFDGNIVGFDITSSDNDGKPNDYEIKYPAETSQPDIKHRKWGNTRFRARGGGAICFVSDRNSQGIQTTDDSSQTIENRQLYTQECCFVNNRVAYFLWFESYHR